MAPATSTATGGLAIPDVRLRVGRAGEDSRWISYSGLTMEAAMQAAQRVGLSVLEIDLPADGAKRVANLARGRRFDLLLFSQELLTLLHAGLNLTEAMATLLAKSKDGVERLTLTAVVEELNQGRSFSEVLARRPSTFPDIYVATVRSSERTGNLPEALGRFIVYQQQFDVLRKKLLAAAIYPAMLLLVGAFVVLFLLGFVVPRFAAVYESSGREVPALSQLLLAMGMLVHDHGMGLAFTAMIVVTVLVWWLRRPLSGRMLVDAVLRLPGIFERATLFRLGRFYRALSLLVISGIALPRAMGMVAGLLNISQQAALDRVRSHIEQGQGVYQALTAGGLASPVAESLIKVGERSGQLGEMLERAAQFHDDEVSRWVDWASRLIEPILMLLIGLVIGAVVVLMYMPIFDLAGSF